MSEKSVMEALETDLEELANFAVGDVVINDYGVFDQWVGLSPYLILSTSDTFSSRMDTSVAQTRWSLGLTLVVQFVDWATTLTAFRDHRQDILDLLNSGDKRVAGQASVDIGEIRSASPILPWHGQYVEDRSQAHPIFLFQDWELDVEEF